jgi:DNA processing protein
MGEVKYAVGFNLIPGIGHKRFSLLQSYFGDLGIAWHASADELRSAGIDAKSVETVLSYRTRISLDNEMEKIERYKVKVVMLDDPDYPPRLKETYEPPPLLYVRGTIIPEDEWAIAVVGTRRVSVYGRQVAEEITADLARHKITIVSGLAKGVDSIAHRIALEAGGRTIAVAGCGVDMVYPSDNVSLARKIIENGALVSEFPLGTKPKAEHFPQRNRIMSGMSLGVLLIEAGEKSGAMITAHWAEEQDREIFAVPGSIFSNYSKGTNKIIQEGAKLVRNCSDILEELNLSVTTRQMEIKEVVPTTDTEEQVLRCLTEDAVHIDELCRSCGLPVAAVSSTLAMLELKGLARQASGMSYLRAR